MKEMLVEYSTPKTRTGLRYLDPSIGAVGGLILEALRVFAQYEKIDYFDVTIKEPGITSRFRWSKYGLTKAGAPRKRPVKP